MTQLAATRFGFVEDARHSISTAIWLLIVAMSSGLMFAVKSSSADDVRDLADKIDRHIEARWKSVGIIAAPVADDAEYLRRVSLLDRVIPNCSTNWPPTLQRTTSILNI